MAITAKIESKTPFILVKPASQNQPLGLISSGSLNTFKVAAATDVTINQAYSSISLMFYNPVTQNFYVNPTIDASFITGTFDGGTF